MASAKSRLGQIRNRRNWFMLITVLAVAATVAAVQWAGNRLGNAAAITGWTLLAATAGMYLLSVRKRCIRLPVGPVSIWLQMHTYLGSFALIVFAMHVGWPIRGWFEIVLASCFTFVSFGGIWLIVLSRTLPRKLAAVKRDYRMEDIPALQAVVAREAQALAISSARLNEGATLAEYYQQRLLPFFHERRSRWYRLLPTGWTRRQLQRELIDLERYLAEAGHLRREKLSELVQAKDDLDFHSVVQSRLRFFFTLHVALTWGLVILIAVHVILVLRFQGAML